MSSANNNDSLRSSEDVDSAATTAVSSPTNLRSVGEEESWKVSNINPVFEGGWNKRRASAGEDDARSINSDENFEAYSQLLAEQGEPLVRQPSVLDVADENDPTLPPQTDEKAEPVTWMQLPKKSQLAVLTLARMSEPLAQTSLQAYMFYQLKSFKLPDGSDPSDETVAMQAGVLAASFTGAQFLTAIMWGRLADSWLGRKRVILTGLLGTAIGSLGFGFSQSFAVAVFWRIFGGLLNGNIGVMRTMISEIIEEKRFQSRAFLLMPLTFNVGVIIGPLLGGWLSEPATSFPASFGNVQWMIDYPYALPNVVNACFLAFGALALVLLLEETHVTLRHRRDYGLIVSRWCARHIFRIKREEEYEAIVDLRTLPDDMESAARKESLPLIRQKLPFRRVFTSNVLFTLVCHGLLAMHVGTFSNLWFVFLSTPRYDPESSRNIARADEMREPVRVPENYHPHFPFTFTGGLALQPKQIGSALAILGIVGISLQFIAYPRISFKLGTLRSMRFSLLLFPCSYFLAPYLAVIPSSRPPPGEANGALIWIGITLLLCIQVAARTFALPATAILVNNSSPHPSVLGTIHGIAQSVSSATRTAGPVAAGVLYGIGLNRGMVGLAWWIMSGVACLGAFASLFVREGDGHEIRLEGE